VRKSPPRSCLRRPVQWASLAGSVGGGGGCTWLALLRGASQVTSGRELFAQGERTGASSGGGAGVEEQGTANSLDYRQGHGSLPRLLSHLVSPLFTEGGEKVRKSLSVMACTSHNLTRKVMAGPARREGRDCSSISTEKPHGGAARSPSTINGRWGGEKTRGEAAREPSDGSRRWYGINSHRKARGASCGCGGDDGTNAARRSWTCSRVLVVLMIFWLHGPCVRCCEKFSWWLMLVFTRGERWMMGGIGSVLGRLTLILGDFHEARSSRRLRLRSWVVSRGNFAYGLAVCERTRFHEEFVVVARQRAS